MKYKNDPYQDLVPISWKIEFSLTIDLLGHV